MWILASFDLPTETKRNRKNASDFRKFLLKDGFKMHQFSVYMRRCSSRENMKVHIKRVKRNLPPLGKVSLFHLTDAQFSKAQLFFGKKEEVVILPPQQLTLF